MIATGDDTYNIPLDTQFSMVWAFRSGVTQVEYHDNNRGQVYVTLFNQGGCGVNVARYPKATLHGVLMWFAWTVLALL